MRAPWSITEISLVTFALAIAAACADNDPVGAEDPPSPNEDAGIPPTPDGGHADGALTNASDADVEIPACSKEGWCPTELPENAKGTTLGSVWGDGQGIVWAVSREGDILRWDGQAWSVARAGTNRLYQIWGSGPTDLWVTSEAGILHGRGTSSASLTWTLTPLDTLPGDPTAVLTTIGGTGPTDIWAAGGRKITVDDWNDYSIGRVLRLESRGGEDAGATWALETSLSARGTLPPEGPSQPLWDHVLGTSSGDLFITGRWLGLSVPENSLALTQRHRHRAPDGKVSWDEMFGSIAPPGDYKSPCGSFSLWAGSPGATGQFAPVAPAAFGNRLWLASVGRAAEQSYAVGTIDPTTRETAWSCASFGYRDGVFRNALFAVTDSEVWAAGDYGRVNHYDGQKWRTVAAAPQPPNTRDLYDVWAGGNEVWVVGKGVAIRKANQP